MISTTHVNRLLAVLVASCVALPSAFAQSPTAEALFRDGRRLIKQGKVADGCAKLEQSEKLESSVGTLLNLGDCRERLGRTADAWAAFRKAEAMAKRDGKDKRRELEARRRAQKLEPDLATITLQVGPKSRAGGLVIKRDGEAIDSDVWGTAIIVDPGSHVIVAEAPGKKPWKNELSIGKGGKRYVVVPTLEPIPEPPKPAAPVVVAPPPPPEPAPVVEATPFPAPRTITVEHTWSTTRGLAVGLGIAGAGALGVGGYFGTRANDLEAKSNAICPTTECTDAEALSLNDRAREAAMRANIFFVAGGAAVAVATVMWFVGKPDTETVIAPAVGTSQVGAAVTGRF